MDEDTKWCIEMFLKYILPLVMVMLEKRRESKKLQKEKPSKQIRKRKKR